jgi:hypothetical protein
MAKLVKGTLDNSLAIRKICLFYVFCTKGWNKLYLSPVIQEKKVLIVK